MQQLLQESWSGFTTISKIDIKLMFLAALGITKKMEQFKYP